MVSPAIPARALEVQEFKWGFDGQVVPGRFNLVSILVANSSVVPFDGTVNFYKTRGLANRVGAAWRNPCYLSPLGGRWLQFYVFVDNQYDQWRLEWGRRADDHFDLDPPKWGAPAQVLLSDASATLTAVGAFKQFPEELFPPTVAATSGLDSVLLDHAPHWEPAKRQAFLSWLRAGGKVHLLRGANGSFPIFVDELGVLNLSAERVRIGAGTLIRHNVTAREMRPADARDNDVLSESKPNNVVAFSQTSESFFQILAGLSQRHYNWAGIYLLAIAYVALMGPGNLMAGRKIADYRLRILLLLATIAGFAFLFNLAGRRGSGEANVVHSLSYARAIDGDTYDVMQWANVFAARGAHYTLTHAAPHDLYATGDEYEAVNGWIQNGKEGKFVVDIPMFSRRAFLHEAEMKGDTVSPNIVRWDGSKLVVSVSQDFAKQVLGGWMVREDGIHTANIANGQLEFDHSPEESVESFAANANTQQTQMAYQYQYGPQNEPNAEEKRFRTLANSLIVWSLGKGIGMEGWQNPNVSRPAREAVDFFLFARSPKSLGLAGGEFREVGYVLYHFDLFKPETEGKL